MIDRYRIMLAVVAVGILACTAFATLQPRVDSTAAMGSPMAPADTASTEDRARWSDLEMQLAKLQAQLTRIGTAKGDIVRRLSTLERVDVTRPPTASSAETDEYVAHIVRQQLAALKSDPGALASAEYGMADEPLDHMAMEAREEAEFLLDEGRFAGALDDEQMTALAEQLGAMDRESNKAFWEQFNEAVEADDVMLPPDAD